MISSVHGSIAGVSEDFLIVEVGGIGLKIAATKAACKRSKNGRKDLFFTLILLFGKIC